MSGPPNPYSAWNPGIGTGIPHALRDLETIFRPECVSSSRAEVEELVGLTGLPAEALTSFRPERLALHELVIRVTADIAVAEGEEEEAFGHNFRQIAGAIWQRDIAPQMPQIARAHAELILQAGVLTHDILSETLFAPPPAIAARFPFNLFARRKRPFLADATEFSEMREQRLLGEFKISGLASADPLRRAVFRSLYQVLGAVLVKHGRLGADKALLERLVVQHLANTYGSQAIGQSIAPLVEAAILRDGHARPPYQSKPLLISLKGASAAGKSSLRPIIKHIQREQGIAADGYVTISPDVWRRLLLDYGSLGEHYKYAATLTARELMVIDGKLDHYIRAKTERDGAMPHLLVDRFRFDSFSTEHVGRVLHNTYAQYVDTLLMYFIVTPPEDTVERGWLRGLERGRYKAVEDFLGHSVEAYNGMPKILFKWLAYRKPDYRYCFLDNSVPKGTFPKVIASGNQAGMTIFDPVALVNIERFQKINIDATSTAEVYPNAEAMAVAANCGFLQECLRRIPVVDFVEAGSAITYLRVSGGRFELLDPDALARATADGETAVVLNHLAPHLLARQ